MKDTSKTIAEKVSEGYYTNQLVWPSFSEKYNPKEDKALQEMVGTRAQIEAFEISQQEAFKANIKTRQDAYRLKTQSLKDEFAADLAEEFGVTNHPKAGRVFEMAWDRGHSDGYREVVIHYEELVELIQD